MTLARRIIPCLDVDAGRVVKGVEFTGLRDMGDPEELAARYNGEGADELVLLDITASRDGRATFLDTDSPRCASSSIFRSRPEAEFAAWKMATPCCAPAPTK